MMGMGGGQMGGGQGGQAPMAKRCPLCGGSGQAPAGSEAPVPAASIVGLLRSPKGGSGGGMMGGGEHGGMEGM